MTKIFVTGISGFVGWHFLNYLENEKIASIVLGVDQHPLVCTENFEHVRVSSENINLLDKDKVAKILDDFKPDYILHLASFSSVAYSWDHPIESFQNNTNIFLNLAEAIREQKLKTRVLSVGSSEEYGNLTEADVPVSENHNLSPLSPYAVARVSQEMLSKVFANNLDIDIIMTRSFNHIGAKQRDTFVVSSFAKQLVEIKKSGRKKGQIRTGDVSIVRDFVDVRDVVSAYYKLLVSGKKGEVYNVCSGVGVSLREIIEKMSKLLEVEVEIIVDKSLIRPNDNKIIIGSNEKIRADIDWKNKINLKKSLEDILVYWQKELSR